MDYNIFDARLQEADTSFDVGYIGQVLSDMLREYPAVTFAVAEKRLREINSTTYLVAVPLRLCSPQLDVMHPVTGERANHFLWICLHGEQEALQTYQRCGIANAVANLEALASCGVLVPGKQLSG
jgi:hypothetical protein